MPRARSSRPITRPLSSAVLTAEGGGNAHGGGLALRGMPREYAGRSVGKAQPGNAEARNAGEISGLTLIDRRVFLRAVNQRQLFLRASSG